MGDALFCERGPFKLEWFLCQEEEDEGLETCPLVFLLDNLERKKSENFWKHWKRESGNQVYFYVYFFGVG